MCYYILPAGYMQVAATGMRSSEYASPATASRRQSASQSTITRLLYALAVIRILPSFLRTFDGRHGRTGSQGGLLDVYCSWAGIRLKVSHVRSNQEHYTNRTSTLKSDTCKQNEDNSHSTQVPRTLICEYGRVDMEALEEAPSTLNN